jgi:catechol 2,3-dioxygenase-like lactoylglutathione lyase family enzyme
VRSHDARALVRPERPTVNINHLDLQVRDVQKTATLYEELLGLHHRSSRTSPAKAILGDDAGFTLVLQRRQDDGSYPEGFHFGFLVDDIERVRAFHEKARERTLDVSDIIENNRGTLVYWKTDDGFLVEVSCPRTK